MSLGGADLVFSDNPLSAMNANPASLSEWNHNEIQFSISAAVLDAEYNNQSGTENDADASPGFIPEFAYVHPLNDRTTLGFSMNPISALEADWEFLDPAGALGITFGQQTHKSSFIVFRSALGIGYEVNSKLAIGASLGLLYNRNRLKAPYVFQSHPVLAGVKVRANLEADGYAFNGVISANYKLNENMRLSLSYTTPSSFDATGSIRGTAPLGIGSYSYDADIDTSMPAIVSGGVMWQTNKKLRLGLQVEWIDWSDAFDNLPLHLTNGTNTVLNGFIGSNRIDDIAPLNWRNRIVFRIGGEYKWSDKLSLRAGYNYGDSPVPAETVTPMSAAIMKHAVSMGAGFNLGKYLVDLSYQWELPTDIDVGTSSLLSGEYNNSSTNVSIHWLSVSFRLKNFLE